jgi:hypothetical protein
MSSYCSPAQVPTEDQNLYAERPMVPVTLMARARHPPGPRDIAAEPCDGRGERGRVAGRGAALIVVENAAPVAVLPARGTRNNAHRHPLKSAPGYQFVRFDLPAYRKSYS